MSLTPKQEKFARCVASGMTQSDAYRASYDVSEDTKPETVNKRSSELMSCGAISGRVEELRAPIVQQAQITLKQHLEELETLREMAKDKSQINAAISAEVARGKASGLYVEKVDANVTGEMKVTKIVRTLAIPPKQ